MMGILTLAVNLLGMAAGPDVVLRLPRLTVGDELTYIGSIVEVGEQIDRRFRKDHELEMKVFVLAVRSAQVDLALMTRVRPRLDPAVLNSAAALASSKLLQESSSAVQLDLLRLEDSGQVHRLKPSTRTTPFDLRQAALEPLPPLPLDAVPNLETGLFFPLPSQPVALASSWSTLDHQRPPIQWTLREGSIWNGSQGYNLEVLQQHDGERRGGLDLGWRRTETISFTKGDGLVHHVSRKIERREGTQLVGWIETRYELQPLTRRLGPRFQEVRAEVELAYSLLQDLQHLALRQQRPTAQELRLAVNRVERFIELQPVPGPFREALESARRGWTAAAQGEFVRVAPTSIAKSIVKWPEVGGAVPEFAAPRYGSSEIVQLRQLRGTPAVLHFFRPGAATAKDSLAVAEAIQQHHGQKVRVVSIAVRDVMTTQPQGVTHWMADGTRLQPRLELPAWPLFAVVDTEGQLDWQFIGQGGETGYLLNEALQNLLARRALRNR